MATINPNDDQNAPQQPNQPSAPMTGGTSASGSGTGKGVGSATASGVQQNPNPQNSQGYTDVASYLNANQGAGAQLGNQVASNLTNQYNTTKQGIDTSAATANSAINAGYTPENTDLISQVAANPTGAAADSGQLSQFQGQLNDTYGGPTSWADMGTQQGNAATALSNASLVNTPGGNNALIQQVENAANPGQTGQGINQLDTMLYQGDPNAVGAAQSAAAPYQGLNDYINSQNTSIGNNIAGAQANVAQTSKDAQGAIDSALGNLNTGAQGELTKAQQSMTDYNTSVANMRNQLAAGNLTGAPGVSQSLIDFLNNNINPLYASNKAFQPAPFNYLGAMTLNTAPTAPTLGTAASKNDYATLQALQSLSGNQNIASPLTGYDATQAGTFKAPQIAGLDNNAVAQAMLNQVQSTGGNLTGTPNGVQDFNQYNNLISSLQQYLGQTNIYDDPTGVNKGKGPDNKYGYSTGPGGAWVDATTIAK